MIKMSKIKRIPNPVQFEYKVVEAPVHENYLNDLGSDGWELISHTFIPEVGFRSHSEKYIFKRQKPLYKTKQ